MTGSIGWWTWLLLWWGMPVVVKAPACSGCAWKLQGMRFVSLAITVAISVAALWWIWPNLKDSVPRGLHKWAMLGLIIACLSPYILYQAFFAKPFDITAYADSIDYEFTSIEYALDFAILNHDAEWVKENGVVVN